MSSKISAMIIIVLLVVALGAFYWYWRFFQKAPLAPIESGRLFPPSADVLPAGSAAAPFGTEASGFRIFDQGIIDFQPEFLADKSGIEAGLKSPVFPLPRPKSEEILKIPTPHAEDFLSRLQDAVDAAEKEIEERQEISTTTEEINLPSLASEEFSFLYPDWFIKSLKEAQNLLISYDPTYQPVAQIQTDADVRYIQEKIISSLFSAAMLTKEEAERYLTTIRFTLPQLQLIELENYRSEIKKTSQTSPVRFLERMFSAATRWPGFIVAFLDKALFPERVVADPPKLFLVYGLIEKLKQIVVIPTSEAGGGTYCGACYISPECFQVGAPAPLGMNTWTAFCYCTGCLFGQGCLDRCTGQSAIWDPTTGICGCG